MQFKAIKPVGDRVLVKVDKEDMKSIGGVLLPSSASKKPTAGKIVSIGDVTLVKVRREEVSAAQLEELQLSRDYTATELNCDLLAFTRAASASCTRSSPAQSWRWMGASTCCSR